VAGAGDRAAEQVPKPCTHNERAVESGDGIDAGLTGSADDSEILFGNNGHRQGRPHVRVRWRREDLSPAEFEGRLRAVAELVLGLPQLKPDRPTVLGSGRGAAGGRTKLSQSPEPLSFRVAEERFAGMAWSVNLDSPEAVRRALLVERPETGGAGGGADANSGRGDGPVSAAPATGRPSSTIPDNGRARTSNGAVSEESEQTSAPEPKDPSELERELKTGPRRQRKPMVINRRPGDGGRHLNAKRSGMADVIGGLEEYGEVSWRQVAGGAWLGIIELDADGNTALACRVSSTDIDRGEILVNQIKPCLALAQRYEELIPRFIVLGYNMAGTREIRGPGVLPRPGQLERDDLTLVLESLANGVIEHAVWRESGRMAREMVPGTLLLRELKDLGAGMWLAEKGRRMDHNTDRLSMLTEMVISEEERRNIVRRTQMGAINKGPLSGRGWPAQKKFGFIRNEDGYFVQDHKQTPWIKRAFELADSGDFLEDGGGLSTRKVTDRLAAEGCPFDHDRIRTLLQDEIHATGAFTVNLRGQPIAQTPIALVDPVPLDRFRRVQMLLELRQGSTKVTPLGEFFLNYISTHHAACGGDADEPAKHSRLYGRCFARSPKQRTYRHYTGGGCQGVTWKRHELEHPIIEAVRQLASHPEIRRQLELATQHQVAATTPAVDALALESLRRQLQAVQAQHAELTQSYVEDLGNGTTVNLAAYTELVGGVQGQIARLERQIKAAEAHLGDGLNGNGQAQGPATSPTTDERLETFLDILTLDPPEDPYQRALRARLLQTVISRVIVSEDQDEGGEVVTVIEIWSPLVPEGAGVGQELGDPLHLTGELLDQEAHRRRNGLPKPMLEPNLSGVQTDLSPLDDKSVWTRYDDFLNMPGAKELGRRNAKKLSSTRWATKSSGRGNNGDGKPRWRLRLRLPAELEAAEAVARSLPSWSSQARWREEGSWNSVRGRRALRCRGHARSGQRRRRI
jgi:hypothetical protein